MGKRGLTARALLASGLAAIATATWAGVAWAEDLVGQPTPGAIDMQPAAAPLKVMQNWFQDWILLPVVTSITLFVLVLLIIVMVRFNKRANPTPSKFTHNTTVEIIWTVVPVAILAFIAIFSFRLLYAFHDMPKPDLTVKVTGYQWYWGYAYPDQKIPEYVSNIVPEEKTTKDLYRLEADNPLVAPVNKVVKVLVTGSDVIHSFAMPAFGIKSDAIPGKVNQTWFKATRTGVFYGQCSELCGTNHAFMPIKIVVVTDAEFARFVAQHHGSMTPAPAAGAPAAASAAPAAAPAPTSSAAPAAKSSSASASSAPAAPKPQ
jgi:cytochrome c oxidase subunit 2